MEESITFNITCKNSDFSEDLPAPQKMECIAKYIASVCSDFQKQVGGKFMKFTVSDIKNKETNASMGTVSIEWTLNE